MLNENEVTKIDGRAQMTSRARGRERENENEK